MQLPGLRDWAFAAKTFAAAMLALYVAMSLGLERPYWAMASAYIASQPLSGATRSKALYRLAGTVLGAAAAVALVPSLANAPPLLSLALALWVAVCLYVSLLDRTPRSYVFMLAGYTAAIIGFPSVDAPGAIFQTALTRVEEIGIGVALASLVAGTVFPRPVGPALIARIDAWLRNARRWSIDAMSGRDTASVEASRLAADGVEINLLASFLAYDATAWETRHFALLRERMVILIPVLASIDDRVRALGASAPAALLDEVRTWIARPSPATAGALADRIDAMQPRGRDWNDLLRSSLLTRLRELVDIAADCERLRNDMAANARPAETRLRFAPEASAAPSWHRDRGMALLSAFACAVAILVSCAAWIATAWPEGSIAAELVAVACSFFAAQDDPVPAIIQFLSWSVVAVIIDGILLFGVLPAATDFVTVMLALAPPFLIGGVLVSVPATSGGGRAFTVNGATLLALEGSYAADLPTFVNGSLAFMLALGLAAVVTRLIRSVGAGFSARRLLRVIWKEIAVAAERRGDRQRPRYAGLMLDRLGLLGPRLAEAQPDAMPVDALTDIRIGFNVIDLRRARYLVTAPVRERLDTLLDAIAASYRARPGRLPDASLLSCIDQALAAVAEQPQGRADALLGLMGIRRGLFPEAPPA